MARHEVFVDAGAWVAIGDVSDHYHRAAAELWGRLLQDRQLLVTTNLVVAESYSLILRGAGHREAMRFLRSLRQSSRVLRLYSTAELEAQAEEILARYSDHDFSLVDAVSFAAMRQRGISTAFAFDRHFRTAGFDLVPDVSSR
jgi:uncharacterized protein